MPQTCNDFEGFSRALSAKIRKFWLKERVLYVMMSYLAGGGLTLTGMDIGHHDGGVVGRGGQFPLSENALSEWVGVFE